MECYLKHHHKYGFVILKGESFCKYKVYLDKDYNQTEKVKKTINPDYQHEKLFSFAPVTKQVSIVAFFLRQLFCNAIVDIGAGSKEQWIQHWTSGKRLVSLEKHIFIVLTLSGAFVYSQTSM